MTPANRFQDRGLRFPDRSAGLNEVVGHGFSAVAPVEGAVLGKPVEIVPQVGKGCKR
jgi:hypothetical protein